MICIIAYRLKSLQALDKKKTAMIFANGYVNQSSDLKIVF